MIIGTPKEIKNHEYRVGLTPESVRELVAHGHRVLVETGAGEGIAAHDQLYRDAGAEIVATHADILDRERVVEGQRVSVRVDVGGRGIIQREREEEKKKKSTSTKNR